MRHGSVMTRARILGLVAALVAGLITGVTIPKLGGSARDSVAFDVEFYVEQ